MERSTAGRVGVLLGFTVAGWIFCSLLMGALPPLVGMETALIIHLVAGPLGFGGLSFVYHRRFGDFAPLTVATVFVTFVVAVDFVLVAVVILGSLDMFRSPIGTWIPFALLFALSWGVGHRVRRAPGAQSAGS